MNFKLLAATTLLFTIGSTTAVLSADQEELSMLRRTKKCIDCNLRNGSFIGNDLRNVNVQRANLSSGSFHSSDLRNSNLSHTNSISAVFYKADLRNTNFSHADVSGANFCGADLRGVNWTGIIYSSSTRCLPDEAIEYVHTVSSNSNQNQNNCPSIAPVSNANPTSLKDNINDVKEATETVKDIINFL